MCDNRINCGCDDCYDDDSMFSECLPFEQVTTVINTTQFEKGQVLQKDTMEAMRSLSDEEIKLLKEGHYSHVQLNGYYVVGDTPAAINYYLSDTADPDDGGSVIEVGDIKLGHEFIEEVNVLYFGAVGDNTTDNAAFLTNASLYVSNNPQASQLFFPYADSFYYTTSKLTLPNNKGLVMDGELSYNGSHSGSAITIGSPDVLSSRVNIRVKLRSTTRSDWSNSDYTGVTLVNLNACTNVEVSFIFGFTRGLVCLGDNNGFAYNSISLGHLLDNKYSVVGTNQRNGWFNQNILFGGRIQRTSSINNGKDRVGILITSEDGSYVNNNNNAFYCTSVGLRYDTDSTESLPILIEHGIMNSFYDIRNEFNGTVFIRTLNASNLNRVYQGYTETNPSYTNSVEDLGSNPSTYITSVRFGLRDDADKFLIFDSGLLVNKTNEYNATNTYITGELYFALSTGDSLVNQATNITRGTTSLTFSSTRAVGVRVNTLSNKRFMVSRVLDSGSNGGRVVVRCFDSSGNIITTPSDAVKGLAISNPTFTSSWGGAWQTGSDSSSNFYFVVPSNCAYADILLRGGNSASVSIQSFKVYAMDVATSVLNPNNKTDDFVANIAPTSTANYGQRTFVKNNNASTPLILGWLFTGSSWKIVYDFGQGVAVPNGSSVDTLLASLRTAGIIAT